MQFEFRARATGVIALGLNSLSPLLHTGTPNPYSVRTTAEMHGEMPTILRYCEARVKALNVTQYYWDADNESDGANLLLSTQHRTMERCEND